MSYLVSCPSRFFRLLLNFILISVAASASAKDKPRAAPAAPAEPAPKLVEIVAWEINSSGAEPSRLSDEVANRLIAVERCGELVIARHPVYGPLVNITISQTMDAKCSVSDTTIRGVAEDFQKCLQLPFDTIDLQSQCKRGYGYIVSIKLLNRIPNKALVTAPAPNQAPARAEPPPVVKSPQRPGQPTRSQSSAPVVSIEADPRARPVVPRTGGPVAVVKAEPKQPAPEAKSLPAPPPARPPTAAPPAQSPPPRQAPRASAAAVAAEEPGFLSQVGHVVMNEVRAEEKQKATAAKAEANSKIESILAPAPTGASARWLGRPVNKQFAVIPGTRSLFTGPPTTVPTSSSKTYSIQISQEQLAAFAAGAEFFSTGGSGNGGAGDHKLTKTTNYVFRAVQILKFDEVDDTSDLQQAPPGAIYYVHAIYYGRSYEVYLRSAETESKKNAGGGLNLGFIRLQLSNEESLKKSGLEYSIESKGLTLTGQSLFVESPRDFAQFYKAAPDAPQPVAVIVEYRKIAPEAVQPEGPLSKILK